MSHTISIKQEKATFSMTGNPDLSGYVRIVEDDLHGDPYEVNVPGELLRQWFAKYAAAIELAPEKPKPHRQDER